MVNSRTFQQFNTIMARFGRRILAMQYSNTYIYIYSVCVCVCVCLCDEWILYPSPTIRLVNQHYKIRPKASKSEAIIQLIIVSF